MIEVYYSKEIPEALIYIKEGYYSWSDHAEYYLDNESRWEEDLDPTVKDSPEVFIKLFEIEYETTER